MTERWGWWWRKALVLSPGDLVAKEKLPYRTYWFFSWFIRPLREQCRVQGLQAYLLSLRSRIREKQQEFSREKRKKEEEHWWSTLEAKAMKVPQRFSSYVEKDKQKSRFYIKAPFYCLQSYLTVSECLGEGGCHFQTRGNLGFVFPSIAMPARYPCDLTVTTTSIRWGSLKNSS